MRKFSKLLLFLLFATKYSYSQIEKTIGTGTRQKSISTFTKFDISLAFQPNKNFGEPRLYGEARASRLLPVGIASSIGYGLNFKKWIGLSTNSGLIFIGNEKLVAVPIFANLEFSPKIGDNTRIMLQYGYGKSLAIGRGNLSGKYQKISLGVETYDGALLFVAIENHGYQTINKDKEIWTLNLGLALISF